MACLGPFDFESVLPSILNSATLDKLLYRQTAVDSCNRLCANEVLPHARHYTSKLLGEDKQMELVDYSYQGFYARFESPSKSVGSLLMGPDNIVGDDYEVFFKTESSQTEAWLKNKFGAEVGFFDIETTRKLQLANGKNQKIRALLSFVAYSDEPDPGCYWGQMAIFCYNPAYANEMDAFIDRCAEKLGEGVRPNIDLGRQAIEKIFSESNWLPSETVPLPKKKTGSAVLKDHRSISEKMIEQGRSRNIGCYIISWAFIALIVVGVLYGIHLLGVF